ncbi:MAG: hypothetical protein HF312_21065 [Ignavibacteria bacterium]|jgi:hypothetical protein|nr:hypothetical protein [Ignavibacteria bacterium]
MEQIKKTGNYKTVRPSQAKSFMSASAALEDMGYVEYLCPEPMVFEKDGKLWQFVSMHHFNTLIYSIKLRRVNSLVTIPEKKYYFVGVGTTRFGANATDEIYKVHIAEGTSEKDLYLNKLIEWSKFDTLKEAQAEANRLRKHYDIED